MVQGKTTRFTQICTLVVAGLLLPAVGSGHALAPSLLELEELDGGHVLVAWKVSVMNPRAAAVRPALTPPCRSVADGWSGAPAFEQVDATGLVRRWTLDCSNSGLAGRRISIAGLESVESSVLVRAVLADGKTAQAVLRGDAPHFTVPHSPTWVQVAGDYLLLGLEHILGGFDHLLFVLGLLFLIRGRRVLLLTVTAFTLGHSVTLSLAALGFVRLPSAPIELAIAASIWVVALELARKDQEGSSWAGRRPWLMAVAFGLLHGFGFAAALAEAGLPAEEVPFALLSFNLGIELGQLAFIAVVLVVRSALQWLLSARVETGRLGRRLELATSYLIGVLATYWCLQRGAGVATFL